MGFLIELSTNKWGQFWKLRKLNRGLLFFLLLLLSQNFKSKHFFSLFWHQNLFKWGVSDWIKYQYVGSILKIEKVKQRAPFLPSSSSSYKILKVNIFSLFWHHNLCKWGVFDWIKYQYVGTILKIEKVKQRAPFFLPPPPLTKF